MHLSFSLSLSLWKLFLLFFVSFILDIVCLLVFVHASAILLLFFHRIDDDDDDDDDYVIFSLFLMMIS